MIKKKSYRLIIPVVSSIFFIGIFSTLACAGVIPPIEPFEATDRVLIISPHPDDDIIACAGAIQHALKAGAKVKVVYVTCGDNNIFSIFFYNDIISILFRSKILYLAELIITWKERFITLGHTRINEAINAERVLGMEAKDLIFLGYPDHGTNQMFIFNWNHTKPYKYSFGGYSSVPYENGLGYRKEFTADNVIEDLKYVISNFKPTKVFVAHSSDVNGDHWASYLYTIVSLADLRDKVPWPKIYPYLVHVPDWPLPRNYNPRLRIEPPEKFFGDISPLIDWHELRLTAQEIDKKHEAMLKHESQTRVSAFYLLAFVRQNELFGDFPWLVLKRQRPGPSDKIIFTDDMQWISYAVVGDSLWIRVKMPRELEDGASLEFFMAGYRKDIPFAKMPNIVVSSNNNKFSILNATEDKYIYPKGASLEIEQDFAIFKIPLFVLGNPEGLLFGFETDEDYMPEGCTAFRVIRIE